MKNISIEVVEDGNIEQCRELCGELMDFQKSKAVLAPETFDNMNFDNRMKKRYENALAAQVILVKDAGTLVGYSFSVLEKAGGVKVPIPDWAPVSGTQKVLGLYPEWDEPQKIGSLANLYFRPEYRGMGLGTKLLDAAMKWFTGLPDVNLVFIHISNGNDEALDFYLKHGFTFSHDVFGGFLKAVCKSIT